MTNKPDTAEPTAAQERVKAIVEWLRSRSVILGMDAEGFAEEVDFERARELSGFAQICTHLADAIERGEHHQGESK